MTASPDTGELPVVSTGGEDDGPLIPSPSPPRAWFVSLVPPKDSLPLDFDPMASGAPDVSAPLSSAISLPDTPSDGREQNAKQGISVERVEPGAVHDVSAETPRAVAVPALSASPSFGQPVKTSPRSTMDRLRGTWSQGLPTPLTVVLVAGLLVPGVLLDVARDGSFGLPSTVLFLVAAVMTPLLLRPRSLPVGVVLPPLAFAGVAAAIAWRSGMNTGTRQIGLDVGTTMALQAPVVFLGTAAGLAVVLARLVVRLVRR